MKKFKRLVLKHVMNTLYPCVPYIRQSILKEKREQLDQGILPRWLNSFILLVMRYWVVTEGNIHQALYSLESMKCVNYEKEIPAQVNRRLDAEANAKNEDEPKLGKAPQVYFRPMARAWRYVEDGK